MQIDTKIEKFMEGTNNTIGQLREKINNELHKICHHNTIYLTQDFDGIQYQSFIDCKECGAWSTNMDPEDREIFRSMYKKAKKIIKRKWVKGKK